MSDKTVILGYWPLVETKDKTDTFTAKELLELSLPDIQVNGCIWALEKYEGNTVAHPILVIKRAKDIARHMRKYSENDITKWFRAVFAKHEGKIVIGLIPNPRKAINRWLKKYKKANGHEYTITEHFEVIFRPLMFCTERLLNYDKIKNASIGSKVAISLLDADDFDGSLPTSSQLYEKAIFLGRFEKAGKGINTWLSEYLEGSDTTVAQEGIKSLLDIRFSEN